MTLKQQTIAASTSIEGAGLHTGETAHVHFVPAEAGHGIRFRRTDLKGAADIPADLAHVASTDRGTSLAAGDARVHTVEHLLAGVVANGIDNLTSRSKWTDPKCRSSMAASSRSSTRSPGPACASRARTRVR
jgi:UDP-3-O-acyl-N-acetylglucosamine deacetylase